MDQPAPTSYISNEKTILSDLEIEEGTLYSSEVGRCKNETVVKMIEAGGNSPNGVGLSSINEVCMLYCTEKTESSSIENLKIEESSHLKNNSCNIHGPKIKEDTISDICSSNFSNSLSENCNLPPEIKIDDKKDCEETPTILQQRDSKCGNKCFLSPDNSEFFPLSDSTKDRLNIGKENRNHEGIEPDDVLCKMQPKKDTVETITTSQLSLRKDILFLNKCESEKPLEIIDSTHSVEKNDKCSSDYQSDIVLESASAENNAIEDLEVVSGESEVVTALEVEATSPKNEVISCNGSLNSCETVSENCKTKMTNNIKNVDEIGQCKSATESNQTSSQSCKEQIDTEFSVTKTVDPFTLSGDEDFSPRAYKPIKRKLHREPVSYTSNNNSSNFFNDYLDTDCDIHKKQKLSDNDISLSEIRSSRHVTYVYNKDLVEKANKLIRIEGRANLVHSLIEVYGILQYIDVIPPRLATESEILGFHCPMYIDFLKGLTDCEDPSDSLNTEAETYGLSYDCPLQEELYETAALISGATVTAAESLISGGANIAVNWCGGWHHAKRDSASGFCYINDIVLGILKLREKFDKVLYVDLDLHHGDGVEEAFCMTPKVMTVSFHKYACGFFPGTGSLVDVGSGRGKLFSLNVPLMDGIGDTQFYSTFTSVMSKVRAKFQGEAVVIQCGADTLSGDPMASFNLTHIAVARCVCYLLTWNLPTLLLGGGGYDFPNTARCWTFLTAMVAGKKLPVDIPEHEHLMEYGPTYELTTFPGNRKDCNTKDHIDHIVGEIHKNLNSL